MVTVQIDSMLFFLFQVAVRNKKPTTNVANRKTNGQIKRPAMKRYVDILKSVIFKQKLRNFLCEAKNMLSDRDENAH